MIVDISVLFEIKLHFYGRGNVLFIDKSDLIDAPCHVTTRKCVGNILSGIRTSAHTFVQIFRLGGPQALLALDNQI